MFLTVDNQPSRYVLTSIYNMAADGSPGKCLGLAIHTGVSVHPSSVPFPERVKTPLIN